MIWFCIIWYDFIWFGKVWYGLVWCGLVWFHMIWFGRGGCLFGNALECSGRLQKVLWVGGWYIAITESTQVQTEIEIELGEDLGGI